ncbi:MAG: hypothetical protein ACRC9O_12800 [Plesiomonas sp.]|uniref:hypothetical protein n=1 Tax=Plesiomonas sp. TaxID=2486279 RepID=UPI003F31DB16
MKLLTSSVFFLTSFTALAAPTQYKNISELMDEYNDYPTYTAEGVEYPSFKVLSDKPLHIQISPRAMTGNNPDGLKYDSEKAAVYAVYRTLYQTPAQRVTVTVLPLFINTNTRGMEYLPSEKIEFSINKKQAANLAFEYGGIRNPDQLITSSGNWSEQFEKCCYFDGDNSRLSKFTQALVSQK